MLTIYLKLLNVGIYNFTERLSIDRFMQMPTHGARAFPRRQEFTFNTLSRTIYVVIARNVVILHSEGFKIRLPQVHDFTWRYVFIVLNGQKDHQMSQWDDRHHQ